MSRGPRASSLGAEARFGREHSPVRFGASFNRMSSTGGAMHPGEGKETMRGLNERLAGYLGQVRLLEEANNKLEAQINEVLTERRAAGQRDWSGYENTLSTLRDQVRRTDPGCYRSTKNVEGKNKVLFSKQFPTK